jgi:hypothetical protein
MIHRGSWLWDSEGASNTELLNWLFYRTLLFTLSMLTSYFFKELWPAISSKNDQQSLGHDIFRI